MNPEADEIDVEHAQRQLDAFLIENPELEQLTTQLDRFNTSVKMAGLIWKEKFAECSLPSKRHL
jgi:hypothetical protein